MKIICFGYCEWGPNLPERRPTWSAGFYSVFENFGVKMTTCDAGRVCCDAGQIWRASLAAESYDRSQRLPHREKHLCLWPTEVKGPVTHRDQRVKAAEPPTRGWRREETSTVEVINRHTITCNNIPKIKLKHLPVNRMIIRDVSPVILVNIGIEMKYWKLSVLVLLSQNMHMFYMKLFSCFSSHQNVKIWKMWC